MTDRMTRNSQHGTQKPSAWYALGLIKRNKGLCHRVTKNNRLQEPF